MNLDILKMTLMDLKQIDDSLLTDFDDFWNAEILKKELLNPNSHYLVAKQKDTILGFGGISQILDEATLTNLVVRKDSRNLGIASLMLENLISIAKNNKASFITLEVNIHNTSAIHLYEKYHFKQVGIRKKYYHHVEDALLMTKKLS